MAITIHKETSGTLVTDRALYATLDGRVVEGDDPAANTLIAAAGRPIPEKLAARYGIKATGKAAKVEEAPAEAPEAKIEAPKVPGEPDREKSHVLGEDRPAVTVRKIDTPHKGK